MSTVNESMSTTIELMNMVLVALLQVREGSCALFNHRGHPSELDSIGIGDIGFGAGIRSEVVIKFISDKH